MAVLILAMVVVSIVGSALWRPAPFDRVTLELGGPTPVGLHPRTADETISQVLELVAPTVAFLTVPDGRRGGGRSGSGVVVHEAGFVVTNAHVVEGAENVLVSFDDGSEYTATVYGIDAATDLAVVRLDTQTPLQAAALGDSDALQVGEFVIALGAPFGLAATATSGIISGLHRTGLGIARYEDFIVTDAPINRGNSGGPLVNLRGEVVGINTAIIAGGEETRGRGGFAGVGFAIPVNVMRVVAQRLIGDGGLTPPAAPPASGGERAMNGEAGTASLAPVPAPRTVARTAFPLAVGDVADAVGSVETFDSRGHTNSRGTGFVIAGRSGNLLLTNAHVVVDAGSVNVSFRGQRFATAGQVVAIDEGLDLALVSFSGADQRPALPVAGSEGVTVGQPVVAGAARLSTDHAVEVVSNEGDVTATGMSIVRLAVRATLIQTDAMVRSGDSGGPLLDSTGSVVGVMVAKGNDNTPQAEGQPSYAIELYPGGNLAWMLGLAADPGFDEDSELAYPPGENYITVLTPDPGSVITAAGLKAFDLILEINGEPLDTSSQARREAWLEMKRLPAGNKVDLLVSRKKDGSDERENLTIPFTVPER